MNEKTAPKALTPALKYCFGVGDFGFVLMSNIETFYFNSFLTDTAGFLPAMAAVINSIFSIIDACLSWIYGAILNSTKAKKWGRYRSWMILTPWIVPFLFACQFIRFSQNDVLAAALIIIAAVVSHIAWNIGYVANMALISVVGKTPDQKAILASSRATWNNIGGLVFSYAGLPLATVLAGVVGESSKWAAAAFVLGILMAVTYWLHFVMTKGYEEIETESAPKVAEKKRTSAKEVVASLFKNPPLIVLILADLAKWCVKFVTAASAIYFFRDACGNPGLMKPYLLVIGVTAIIGAYLVRYLSIKLSSRTSMIIGCFGMAIFLFLGYLNYASSTSVIIFMGIAMFFYGMAFAASPALYADTVVYATWKTGKDASGWIMGLQNVPLKAAIFLRGIFVNAGLVWAGWQTAGVVLEGKAAQGLTYALCLIPAIFCIVAAFLLLFGFRLTKAKVAQYQAEIDARR